MKREFDAIVFGASGFTGGFVVEEMAISMEHEQLYKSNHLDWAIAGRNKEKLACILERASHNTKIDWLTKVPIIEADVEDYDSLVNLCKRTRLIISVVGPYRFFGEPVVKAAIEAGTDYVDISGEPQFLEGMQLKYFDEAKKKGVYIVSASGWDSIPADMGTTWTKKQFTGDLGYVEIVVSGDTSDEKGAKLNFGTWHSAIYGYAKMHELRPLREKLYKEVLHAPQSKSPHKPPKRSFLAVIDEVEGRVLPFMGSDKTVVQRSEILKYMTKKERPVYCETYFKVGSYWSGMLLVMAASVFAVFAKNKPGRYLLKKYPGFFSFGMASRDGVPRASIEKSSSCHTIIAYGWDEKYEDVDRQHEEPPTKKIITRISGPEAGYIATSSYLVHAGMTLIFDREKLPEPGVLTPGACFGDTYLIDRLSKRNIKFEVVSRF